VPGFGLRLRGDTRRWICQYRVGRQQRRESLGDPRKVSLDDARRIARQRFAQVELGVDPAADRAKARAAAAATKLTLAVVSERYLDARKSMMRPSTYTAAVRNFKMHWAPLRDQPIESIRHVDVAARLGEIAKASGPIAAARARATLAALYAWADFRLRSAPIFARQCSWDLPLRRSVAACDRRDQTLSCRQSMAYREGAVHALLRAGGAPRDGSAVFSTAILRRNASMRLMARRGTAQLCFGCGGMPACLALRCAISASS
jgi:hypothetical protein